MDQGDGTFQRLDEPLAASLDKLREDQEQAALIAKLWPKVFVVGEEVTIRKSRFCVEVMGVDLLVLRLLPTARGADAPPRDTPKGETDG